MAVKQTAGRDALGEFAPKFAELNDDVLFGQVWSREDRLSLRDRSLVTVVALMAQGLTDESFRYHLLSAKKNGITREEIAEIVTHAAFYCGWPKAWAVFRAEKRYFQENRAVWRALEDAQAAGKVRVIGVSNFLRDDLENLLTGCRVRPAVNQLLLHIAGTDLPLLDYCTRQDIRVEAYSPIAHGEALKNPAITAMAEKYGVSVPQLCIRYVLQLGAVALPKTADPGHMRSNAAVDFAISPEDMETLRSMEHLTDYGDYNGFPVFSGKPLA